MNAEVEQRIVEMRFDNEQFEKGAKQTLSTLEKLDSILDLLGSGGGLDRLGSALDQMQYRFSAFGIAGAAAIDRITGRVINLASNLLTAIPEQIIAGGTQRALNIENAKFQLKGLGVAWEEVADDIDHAVMGTAYGVDEAAKAAAILAASKVDFKNAADQVSDMGVVLRSISGLAAMTNSSYDEIGNLMGDIFAMGKLSTRQLQSFELRGLNVAAKLAEVLQEAGSGAKHTEEEIRDLVSKGKIDALTFAKAMDAAFGEHATAANDTYTGSLRNMKAALSRIGADFVAPIHEGERIIMLSLRKAFDNIRKITRPLAEGKFTSVLSERAEKLAKVFENWDFTWLERISEFFNKSNAWVKPIDWLIAGLTELNEISKRLFSKDVIWDTTKDTYKLIALVKIWTKAQGPKLVKIVNNVKDALKKANLSLTPIKKNVGSIAKAIGDLISNGLTKIVSYTEKLKNGDKISKALTFIGTAVKRLETVVISFGRLGKAAFEVIAAVVLRLYGRFRESGAMQTFGSVLSWLAEKVVIVVNKMTSWLTTLKELISKEQPAGKALGTIGTGLGVIGDVLGSVIGGLRDFIRFLFGLEEGETIFSAFGTTARQVGEWIRNAFRTIRTAIQNAFGENGVGKDAIKIAAALYTVLIGYREIESKKFGFGRLGRTFEFLKELLTKTYDKLRAINPLQWADDIETLLRKTGGTLRAFSDNLNAKSLLTIAGAVVALAFGLTILAAVAESDHAWSALGLLAATMGLLVGALAAIKVITDQGLFKNITLGWAGLVEVFKNGINKYFNAIALKETATALLIFAAAVGVLAISVGILAFAFSKLGAANMWQSALMLAGLAGILVGVTYAFLTFTNKLKAVDSLKLIPIGLAIIAVALAIDLLVLGLIGLGAAVKYIGGGKLWNAIGMIAALAVVLGGITVALDLFILDPLVLAAAAAMVLIAAAIDILILGLIGLGAAVEYIGGGKLWNAIGMIAVLAVILSAITIALSMFAPAALLAAPATIMIALAIDILILGLIGLGAAVEYIGGGKLWNAIGMITVLLVIFTAMMTIIGLLSPILMLAGGVFLMFAGVAKILSEAFVNIADGMISLALALNLMPADGSLEAIGTGLGSVAGGLAKIAGSGFLMNFTKKNAFDGLIGLGTAMTVLEDVDIATLADKRIGLPALAEALEGFAGSWFFGLGSLGSKMAAGNLGLTTAGPALAALGLGLKELGPGLEAMAKVENTDTIIANIEALNYAVTGLSDFSYGKMMKSLPDLATSLERIISAINSISSEKIEAVRGIGPALGETFTKNKAQIALSLSNALDELIYTIDNRSADFIMAGEKLPAYIQNGAESKQEVLASAGNTLITVLMAVIDSDANHTNWRTIGGNITIGIANGIMSRTQEAANAMRNLAAALQTSFTVSLQIRSPSRVFEYLTGYIPMAIVNRLKRGETEVSAAMADCIGGAVGVMDQYAKNAGTLTPQLTPVMDISGIRRDMAYADRVFQNSNIGNYQGINGLTVHGDSISYNMQNRDVVNEIKQMSSQIAQLGQAIESMQMVLDTGALVGNIGRAMNRELGTIAIREKRQ